jgi:hypothetical protein
MRSTTEIASIDQSFTSITHSLAQSISISNPSIDHWNESENIGKSPQKTRPKSGAFSYENATPFGNQKGMKGREALERHMEGMKQRERMKRRREGMALQCGEQPSR